MNSHGVGASPILLIRFGVSLVCRCMHLTLVEWFHNVNPYFIADILESAAISNNWIAAVRLWTGERSR